jgi:hypothetical protein
VLREKKLFVTGRTMYDRDTAPGAEPEELRVMKIPALIISGNDPAHATSAAQSLAGALARRCRRAYRSGSVQQDGE